MAGQADPHPQLTEDVAAVAAEAFFTPGNEYELVAWGKLRYWQLGPTEQARWRLVASRIIAWLKAEKERRIAEARSSPATSEAGPLFSGGAAR